MKQIILVLVITITIIVTSIYINFFLKSSSQTVISHINKIEQYSKNGNWDSAVNEIKLSDQTWDQIQGPWSVLIEHQEIDNIETSLKKIEKYVETKSLADVLAETANSRLLINHIPETFIPSLKNIF